MTPQQEEFLELARAKMPYGKYQGRFLIDLPEYYLVWLKNNRLPQGKLGKQIVLVYEIKLNGLEPLVRKFQNQ